MDLKLSSRANTNLMKMKISETKTEIKPLSITSSTPIFSENIRMNYPTTKRRDQTQKYLNSTRFNHKLTNTVFNDDLY